MRTTVLNIEPYLYNPKAISKLEKYLEYRESSWEKVRDPVFYSDAEVIIVRLGGKVDKTIIRKFTRLKYIVSATTGLDHIDLDYCNLNNIVIVCLRPFKDFINTIPSTAEMTFALLFSLVRNIPDAVNDVRLGNWNRDQFRGHQLFNKTLGIIGLGRTGLKVASYAKAFGMNIMYYDPYVYCQDFERIHDLGSIFNRSDFVTLHVHLMQETKHMIDKEVLKHCKPGLMLVNTSRGELIQELDLIESMKIGLIGGIATDVITGELEDITENILHKNMQSGENIIITPHIGGATFDAMHMCEEFIADKLLDFYRNAI